MTLPNEMTTLELLQHFADDPHIWPPFRLAAGSAMLRLRKEMTGVQQTTFRWQTPEERLLADAFYRVNNGPVTK